MIPDGMTVLELPAGGSITVDAGIADVLILLWDRGYDTRSSFCSGMAMIEFERDSFDNLVQSSPKMSTFIGDTECITTRHIHTKFDDDADITHTVSVRFDVDRVPTFNDLLRSSTVSRR